MKFRTIAFLTFALAGVSSTVCYGKEDSFVKEIAIANKTFQIYGANGYYVLLPERVGSGFTRSNMIAAPDCATFDRSFKQFESALAACGGQTPSSPNCLYADSLIKMMRFPAGSSTGSQTWTIRSNSSQAAEIATADLNKIAQLYGVPVSHVVTAFNMSSAQLPQMRVSGTATDSRVAHIQQLMGPVDRPVSFNPQSSMATTNGDDVACDLMEKKAAITWEQDLAVTADLQRASDLDTAWGIRETLRKRNPSPDADLVERAVLIGARLAGAITQANDGKREISDEALIDHFRMIYDAEKLAMKDYQSKSEFQKANYQLKIDTAHFQVQSLYVGDN